MHILRLQPKSCEKMVDCNCGCVYTKSVTGYKIKKGAHI